METSEAQPAKTPPDLAADADLAGRAAAGDERCDRMVARVMARLKEVGTRGG